MVVEGLCWGSPAEGLAGSAVEGRGDGGEVAGGVLAQVSAFGEVLPLRVAEVDRQRLPLTAVHFLAPRD